MEQFLGGVYLITNDRDDRRYAGSSANIKNRFGNHRSDLRNNRHRNKRLQEAWNEYGEDAFTFTVMERTQTPSDRKAAAEVLAAAEQWWFDELHIDITYDFNIAPVAGSNLGFKHTEETKALLSEQRKGRTFTDEQRARMSLGHMGNPSNTGKKATAETRAKQSAAHKGNQRTLGYKHTDEAKANMSAAHKGIPRTPEWIENQRKGALEHLRLVELGLREPQKRRRREDMTEEERSRRSAGASARWERRRANASTDSHDTEGTSPD
jgi:group I intron endonuclease